MKDATLTKEQVRVEMWCRIDLLPPSKTGYYRVQDYDCKTGVAFMHPNRTWTPIEGPAKSPFFSWMDIA